MSKKYIIVNFFIQKLKSKHTCLKKYTNWAKLIYFLSFWGNERRKKPNISHPRLLWIRCKGKNLVLIKRLGQILFMLWLITSWVKDLLLTLSVVTDQIWLCYFSSRNWKVSTHLSLGKGQGLHWRTCLKKKQGKVSNIQSRNFKKV